MNRSLESRPSAGRVGLVLLLACLLVAGPGCFGSFGLTQKVHKFNRDVSPNQWVQEVVFLAFVFIPVYGVSTFVDAIVINSIEFWTGTNPMAKSEPRDGAGAEDIAHATPDGSGP